MLIKHARRTVIEDQSIRLSDSGDPTQGRLLVNQIAIDLPVRLSRKGAPALTGATQLAIAMGDRCLKPSVLATRSEEHTSELQSLMRTSYAVFCMKKKNINKSTDPSRTY